MSINSFQVQNCLGFNLRLSFRYENFREAQLSPDRTWPYMLSFLKIDNILKGFQIFKYGSIHAQLNIFFFGIQDMGRYMQTFIFHFSSQTYGSF